MNWEHFRAFLWLRWRLLVNQLRRGGTANAVVLAVLLLFLALFAVGMSITFLVVGLFSLSSASSGDLLLVWDGLVLAFLFFWMMGLLLELQRSEVLSLDKLLHLPVSLRGAFVINYLSSLFSVSLAVFMPAMLALGIGLAVAKGPALLLQFPLLAAFVLMVTALTYQFQGWLASLMANPRRRRTVIVVVTMAFVLLVQIPNLLNISRSRHEPQPNDAVVEQMREQTELGKELESGKIDREEYNRRSKQIKEKYQERIEGADRASLNRVEQSVRVYNIVIPLGWLPLGAADTADGKVLPALLGILGMGSIGAVSLWRSYRTTVRLYTGQFSSGKRKPVAAAAAPSSPAGPASVGLLERQLPGVSERTAAIALSGFRSLLRAPEAKMLLLSPLILILVFGSLYGTRSTDFPEALRPLMAFGGMAVILLSMGQLAGNQFGFDRAGFRVFVLSAAPRRDILMGKNLALAPIALTLGLVMVVLVEVLQPMRLEHLLAVVPEFVCMYVPYCLLANLMSMIAPMAIRAGSFKAFQPKGITILLHLAFAISCPLLMLPALLPLGIEYVLEQYFGWVERVPVCLILSLLEAAGMIGLYRLLVGWEGNLLQAREKTILDIVTARTE